MDANRMKNSLDASSASVDGFSYSPESFLALKNAYLSVRDKYNKLKVENQNLLKHIYKNDQLSPKKKTLQLNSATGEGDVESYLRKENSNQSFVSEPRSTSTLIAELEQLREKLDHMSREAQTQSFIDPDIKDMMVSVIPKLKEFERQCSSLSEESARSLGIYIPNETFVNAVEDEKRTLKPKKEDGVARQEIPFLPENMPISGDNSLLSLSYGSGDFSNDLQKLVSDIDSQSGDLSVIYNTLMQQKELLNQMRLLSVRKQCPSLSGNTSGSPEISEWSIIPNN